MEVIPDKMSRLRQINGGTNTAGDAATESTTSSAADAATESTTSSAADAATESTTTSSAAEAATESTTTPDAHAEFDSTQPVHVPVAARTIFDKARQVLHNLAERKSRHNAAFSTNWEPILIPILGELSDDGAAW